MINFGGVTHLIKYSTGLYGFVGAVPLALWEQRKPTREDIMAGRVHNGVACYRSKTFATPGEAVEFGKANGARMCDLPGCACRKMF